MGIIFTIFLVYQWDHVVPVLEFLGIIDWLDSMGLIYEDAAYLTGFSIFMFAIKATIIFCILVAVFLVLGIILTMIGSSSVGFFLLAVPFIILFSPFLFIYVLIKGAFETEEEKAENRRIYLEGKKTILELIQESSEELTKEQAFNRLNRLPTSGDTNFLIAVTKNEDIYLLLPNPVGVYFHEGVPAEKLAVEKTEVPIGKDPTKLPNRLTATLSETGSKYTTLPIEDINYIYNYNKKDFNPVINKFITTKRFDNYLKKAINSYFTRKFNLKRLMSESKTREDFNNYASQLVEMNAFNEDIVKMMWESEQFLTAEKE
ncbi:hypothetical protein AWM68_17665 [Fictibacillus phosphorivorans]|uniref:Uncharacterized protein n=2 Tax=Fictibacillus phosphorivorans TaxID=1221500 RepID=A0A163S2D3_9BACL|nr:hypothetical protein AWM68_17665 [Fictibacillus phosphorivorans]